MRKHNLETNEGRLAALDAAAAIVGHIKDYGLRDRYAVSLDRWLGMMDEDFVLARVRARAPSTPAQRRAGRTGAAGPNARPRQNGAVNGRAERAGDAGGGRGAPEVRYNTKDPVIQTEREALKLAVQRPALCGPAFDALGAETFTAPVHAAVFGIIAECGGAAWRQAAGNGLSGCAKPRPMTGRAGS